MKIRNSYAELESYFIQKKQRLVIPSLDWLVIYFCDFNSSCYRKELFKSAKFEFPTSLNGSVLKRQSEFLAGRYTASLALQELGSKITDVPIGEHRCPIWPSGIVASITHTNTSALCAAANERNTEYIGVDLEEWLTSCSSQNIRKYVIQSKEEFFLKTCSLSFEKALTLTFSAKESLFKALYPKVGYYFDFTAAEIISISLHDKTFELILRENLTPILPSGTVFRGRFKFDNHHILTLIIK